jgi:hypothetical protein
VITNLAAYYDRQLTNVESVVVKSIGVERKMAKLIAKIIPAFKHHVCIGYGISKASYGSNEDHYGRTGQGNLFSGEACKYKSCRIIKKIEDKDLRVITSLLITEEEIQRVVLAFVDDTSFYTNSGNMENNMREIIRIYTRLYKAIEGKVEQSKSYCYAWQ